MQTQEIIQKVFQYKWWILAIIAAFITVVLAGYYLFEREIERKEFRNASTCHIVYQNSYDKCIRNGGFKTTCYNKANEKKELCNIFKIRRCIKGCMDRWSNAASFENCKSNCQVRYN